MSKLKRKSELPRKLQALVRMRTLRDCQNLATPRNNQKAAAAKESAQISNQESCQRKHQESAPFIAEANGENIQVSCWDSQVEDQQVRLIWPPVEIVLIYLSRWVVVQHLIIICQALGISGLSVKKHFCKQTNEGWVCKYQQQASQQHVWCRVLAGTPILLSGGRCPWIHSIPLL